MAFRKRHGVWNCNCARRANSTKQRLTDDLQHWPRVMRATNETGPTVKKKKPGTSSCLRNRREPLVAFDFCAVFGACRDNCPWSSGMFYSISPSGNERKRSKKTIRERGHDESSTAENVVRAESPPMSPSARENVICNGANRLCNSWTRTHNRYLTQPDDDDMKTACSTCSVQWLENIAQVGRLLCTRYMGTIESGRSFAFEPTRSHWE